MFGDEMLMRVVAENQHKSAADLAETILAEVTEFQGDVDRFDDETVVVLRVIEGPPPSA
jgi:serine phosphatase RsbU (regulator of sigma subunit)